MNLRTCSPEGRQEMYLSHARCDNGNFHHRWSLVRHEGRAFGKESQLRAQAECAKAQANARGRQGGGQIIVFPLEGITWGGGTRIDGEIVP